VDGQKDDRTIITSSVVRVRFEGDPPLPIAVTASGSEYWLGEPSEKVGPSAEQFMARKAALEVAAVQVGGESVTRYAAPGIVSMDASGA
jgi:hypothetical protein